MDRLYRVIEVFANVSIILIAVYVGYFFLGSSLSSVSLPNSQSGLTTTPEIGTKLNINGVSFGDYDKNLVLVLSTTCHFCAESMPFYSRLTELNANNAVKITAVFPQNVDEARKYLISHKVSVNEIVNGQPQDLQARGTPTLILLDRDGEVTERWIGKLSADREAEVLEKTF